MNDARARLDRLAKPPGSLGRLEDLADRLCTIAGTCPPPRPAPVTVAVFAGDHGVLAQGVSPWPQDITAAMVRTFAMGGAAVNVLARQVGADVLVVDVGVATPVPGALDRNVRRGTADLSVGPAMTVAEARQAFEVGREVARTSGAGLLVTGDMGIGNTTPSAAIIAALTGRDADEITGRGTGIDDETFAKKTAIVGDAVARVRGGDAMTVLAEVGGLEIAAIAGFVTEAASMRVPVVVDGVIALAGLLVAATLDRAWRVRRPRAPQARAAPRPGHAPRRGNRRPPRRPHRPRRRCPHHRDGHHRRRSRYLRTRGVSSSGTSQFLGDAAEHAVHEAAGVVGGEALGELDGLVDARRRRHVGTVAELVDRHPQQRAIDDRHALERPPLGEAADELVDLLAVHLHAVDDVDRVLVRFDRQLGDDVVGRRALGVGLVQQLERALSRVATGAEIR
jgi:nicotinate-nucleotide--dimethylbenzimidazole phosphoribosyltransferase